MDTENSTDYSKTSLRIKQKEFEDEKEFVKRLFILKKNHPLCRRQSALFFLKRENRKIFSLLNYQKTIKKRYLYHTCTCSFSYTQFISIGN